MFLTDDELYLLTGYQLPSYQTKWLTSNGIKFLLGGDGRPRVLTKHLEEVMCYKLGNSTERKRTQPNEEALRRLMGLIE